LNALSEPYWAGLYAAEHIVLHEPDEGEFYRYDEETGLYREHTSARIKTEIASRLLEAADNWKESGLVKLRKDSILNGIVAHLRGQIEHREAFSKKDRRFIHLANGVVVFDGDKAALTSFSPEYRSRNQSPIAFDPKATCDRFLDELIRPAVHEEDVLLLQKFAGLFLLGDNIIQRVLVLDGTPGGGKSQFCQVMQNLIGKVNCTQLRTELLAERFEIYRFLKKSLLYGADVPADFLNTKGASRLKSLVGGDLLDAECKGHKGSFPVEGRFNVLVTSNARLRVHLEGDIGAWRRRLTIVRYENPPPKKKIPDFGQLLIDTEGSGILNWALVGLSELFKDVADTGDIRLTGRQNKVVESLLAESDSLRIFLKDQMESAPNSDVTIKDIKEAYAVYCPSRGWNALPITIIERQLEGLMLELFHVCKSNSCGDNKKERGFRGVRFMHDGGLL
jgi:putative DNA primase/helicase